MRPASIVCKGIRLGFYSFSDHPGMWAAKEDRPGFNYIDVDHYKENDISAIRSQIASDKESHKFDMVVVSLHWGSNYCWEPSVKFKQFAKALIDAGVDIIHGHSSHHVQGIEIYKGKPIFYGCGDFVDDYAVDSDYRNDLGFAYFLTMDATSRQMIQIELVPTQIELFSVNAIPKGTIEHKWLCAAITKLSSRFGTKVEQSDNGHLLIKV